MSITRGTPFTDDGATCVDVVDASCVVIVSGSVNTAISGNYTLTYSATDAAGNDATVVTRTVSVSQPSGG